jgi:pyruvate dehydrogenase (quinone)
VEKLVSEWQRDAQERAEQPANPVNPQLLFTKLAPLLPDNAILAADSGTSTVWYARHLPMRDGMKGSVSGTLATMGCALPYALAGKLAFPDRVAFAFLGDGAMQMSGMTELITVAESWQHWDDPRLILLVLNNRDLSYVTWEQRAMEGEPRFEASQSLPDVRYADYAKLLGLNGTRVERPADIEAAWEAALRSDRPFLIDAVTDPNVPTIPPDPSPEVKETLAEAIREEPSPSAIVTQIEREGTNL